LDRGVEHRRSIAGGSAKLSGGSYRDYSSDEKFLRGDDPLPRPKCAAGMAEDLHRSANTSRPDNDDHYPLLVTARFTRVPPLNLRDEGASSDFLDR